jgi:mannose-6-phosphate isomerase
MGTTLRASEPPDRKLRFAAPYPVLFEPCCKERVWGGHRLKSWYSLDIQAPVGEYWLVSAHPAGPSVVKNGVFRGKTLEDLVRLHPRAYLGRTPCDRWLHEISPQSGDSRHMDDESLRRRFPLLIKLIEASDHLSVQVHPDDGYALKKEKDFGKTEAWYILDPGEAGEIIYGHRFDSAEQLLRAVRDETIGPFLERAAIRQDELVYVPAGTVHAILKGTVLLEIQQSSDVTYRLYDWDRKDASGKGRELHIEQAVSVMRFGPSETGTAQEAVQPSVRIAKDGGLIHDRLLSGPYFAIERMEAEAGWEWTVRHGREGNPDVLIILEGEGELAWAWGSVGTGGGHGEAIGGQGSGSAGSFALRKGDAVLVPAGLPGYRLHAFSRMKIIRTYY